MYDGWFTCFDGNHDFARPRKSISWLSLLVGNTRLSVACLCGPVWYTLPVFMASLVSSVRYLRYRDEWQFFLTGRTDSPKEAECPLCRAKIGGMTAARDTALNERDQARILFYINAFLFLVLYSTTRGSLS